MSEQRPTEAQEIIAAQERLGLNALDSVQAIRREVEGAGKDFRRNHDYQKASATLDGICEALGLALWVQKHYAAGGAAISTVPSTHEALMHLHDLKAKTTAEAKR